MKRIEKKARKDQLRHEIEARRNHIHTFLKTLRKIPDEIVNGTLTDVVNYKAYSEKAGQLYHVNNAPAKRATIGYLERINRRLVEIMNALRLLKAFEDAKQVPATEAVEVQE
jgi:hypothetical protein